jgi:hypothetical protein
VIRQDGLGSLAYTVLVIAVPRPGDDRGSA